MDPLPPATRRANRWLFAALVVFAIALAITCYVWMRGVVRANGGIVDPPPRHASLRTAPVPRGDFVLPTAPPCLT